MSRRCTICDLYLPDRLARQCRWVGPHALAGIFLHSHDRQLQLHLPVAIGFARTTCPGASASFAAGFLLRPCRPCSAIDLPALIFRRWNPSPVTFDGCFLLPGKQLSTCAGFFIALTAK